MSTYLLRIWKAEKWKPFIFIILPKNLREIQIFATAEQKILKTVMSRIKLMGLRVILPTFFPLSNDTESKKLLQKVPSKSNFFNLIFFFFIPSRTVLKMNVMRKFFYLATYPYLTFSSLRNFIPRLSNFHFISLELGYYIYINTFLCGCNLLIVDVEKWVLLFTKFEVRWINSFQSQKWEFSSKLIFYGIVFEYLIIWPWNIIPKSKTLKLFDEKIFVCIRLHLGLLLMMKKIQKFEMNLTRVLTPIRGFLCISKSLRNFSSYFIENFLVMYSVW